MNILLDDDGDWAVADGELQTVTGRTEIEQMIMQRLKTVLGEWFLDVRIGIPYFSEILVKRPNAPAIEAIFINEIATTPGVTSVDSIELTADNATRKLTVAFRCQTVDGIIDFSGVVP